MRSTIQNTWYKIPSRGTCSGKLNMLRYKHIIDDGHQERDGARPLVVSRGAVISVGLY